METLIPAGWQGRQQPQQAGPWATRLPGGPQGRPPGGGFGGGGFGGGHGGFQMGPQGMPMDHYQMGASAFQTGRSGPMHTGGSGYYGPVGDTQMSARSGAGAGNSPFRGGGGGSCGTNCARMVLIAILGSICVLLVVLVIRFKKPPPTVSTLQGVTIISIRNDEWADGVVFCRGPVEGSMGGVFLDPELTKPVVHSEFDCSVESSQSAKSWGVGVPGGTTLALGLGRGQETYLYIHPNTTWPSGACWFQDALSNAKVSLAKGPRYMSLVEFTIQESGKGQVFYDMSSVEGVSGGISMNYTDDYGRVQTDVAVPGKFQGTNLKVVPAPEVGFPTVLSDKNTRGSCRCLYWNPNSTDCNSDACFAGCPGALVDNACGQHRCRVFYAKLYQDPTSYCGWLYTQQAQTYCWAMDEWICTDQTCGYGGIGQPKADCSTPFLLGAAANSYSCGHGANLPGATPGSLLWKNGGGCVDKQVKGVPTNPAPPRFGGRITISFEALPWLHEAMR